MTVEEFPPEGLWTINDVAAFMKVPVGTVRVWLGNPKAPRAYKVGKHLRFNPNDWMGWLAEREMHRDPDDPIPLGDAV